MTPSYETTQYKIDDNMEKRHELIKAYDNIVMMETTTRKETVNR